MTGDYSDRGGFPPMKALDGIKVVVANVASWVATVVSIQFIKDALQIVALVGSIAVSLGSLWWIKRQARALELKERQPHD
jgi:hypothetical protein